MVRTIFAAFIAVVLCLFSVPAFGLSLGMSGDERKLDLPVSVIDDNVDHRAGVMVRDISRPLDTQAISAMQAQWDRAERRNAEHAKQGTRPFECPTYYTEGNVAAAMALTERRLADLSDDDDVRPIVYGMRFGAVVCSLGKKPLRVPNNKSAPLAVVAPVAAQSVVRLDSSKENSSGVTTEDYLDAARGNDPNFVGLHGPSLGMTDDADNTTLDLDISSDRGEDDPSCVTLEVYLDRTVGFNSHLGPFSADNHVSSVTSDDQDFSRARAQLRELIDLMRNNRYSSRPPSPQR